MRFNKVAIAAAAANAVNAQGRPDDVSICDYYTTALLENNTAENQATLLTLVVNTVVIGNYTQPNVGIKVPGILAPGKVGDVDVDLMPYFNGELASTNRGGKEGVKVNFLDDGGADPLKENKPANGEDSEQYFLLTHLYQFFGSLLGCSEQGMPGFDAYMGNPSMFEVHKFMNLNNAEMTYFITQVGMAAASFGVAESDVEAVGDALMSTFNMRCSPAAEVIPGKGAKLQAICIDEDTCELAEDADCDAYMMPPGSNTTMTMTMSEPGMPTPTGPTETMEPTPVPTAGAMAHGLSLAAVIAGVGAFVL